MTPLHPTRLPAGLAQVLARLVVATFAVAAVISVAASEIDPAAAAEGLLLGRLLLFVLPPLALVAAFDTRALLVASTLLAAVPWLLPAGPARGAVLQLGLAALVAVAAARFVGEAAATGREQRLRGALGWVGLALASQAVLRGAEVLIAPLDLAALVRLLALPAAGAGLLAVLEPRHGRLALLAGSGAALLLAPGFNLTLLVTLATLFALSLLLAPTALASPLLWRLGAAAALVGLGVARPAAVLVAAAAGLLVLLPGTTRHHDRPASLRVAAALAAFALITGAFHLAVREGSPLPAVATSWLLVLLPALWLAARLPLRAFACAVLGVVATLALGEEAALSAPFLLGAILSLGDDTPPRVVAGGPSPPTAVEAAHASPAGIDTSWFSRLARLQLATLCAAWLGVGVLAGYPWLRQRPLQDLAPYLALPPTAETTHPGGPTGAAPRESPAPLAVAATLAFDGALAWTGAPTALAPALPAALGALDLPLSPRPKALDLPGGVLVLDRGRPTARLALPVALEASMLALESHATNVAGLPAGTPIATLRVVRADGSRESWSLRVGYETADWAAARSGVTAPLPTPALSWVPAGGGFFAHRYRAVRPLAAGAPLLAVGLVRESGLADDVAVAISRLEVWR